MTTFSGEPGVLGAIESARPPLMAAGGVFLVLLFIHWLFQEEKQFGLPGEEFFRKNSVWFYAASSLFLTVMVWLAAARDAKLAFAACVGSTAFFITTGFKDNAESQEASLAGSTKSDLAKLLYLEIIDLTFSIDGVLGAFAFTLSIPLILIVNGIGAFMVRAITVSSVESIRKYRFLKNGAMYSILALGSVMVLESFGIEVPEWVSPVSTIAIIGYFFAKSVADSGRKA